MKSLLWWQWGSLIVAVFLTGCIASANVMNVLFLDPLPYRLIMLAIGVAADIGAVVCLFAMVHWWRYGPRFISLLAFVVWIGSGASEIYGMTELAKRYVSSLEAPSSIADQKRENAKKDAENEEANLASIRKSMNTERKEELRNDLRRREKASIERLEKLRPKTLSAKLSTGHAQWSGNEWLLAFAVWLSSQSMWSVALGNHLGESRGIAPEQYRMDLSGFGTGSSPQSPIIPDGDGNGPRGVEKTVEGKDISGGDHPHPQLSPPSTRRSLTLVPKNEFEVKVLAMRDDGYSVDAIRKELRCRREKVSDVIKKYKSVSTRSSA